MVIHNHISVCSLWIACEPMQYFVRTVLIVTFTVPIRPHPGLWSRPNNNEIKCCRRVRCLQFLSVFISAFLSKLPFSYLLLLMYLCAVQCACFGALHSPALCSNMVGFSGLWLCTERSKLNCFLQVFFVTFHYCIKYREKKTKLRHVIKDIFSNVF